MNELAGVGLSYELELDKCFVCGGVWCEKGELDKYLTDQVEVIDSPSLEGQVDKSLDGKQGNCPQCKIRMKRTAAPKLPELLVDVCEKCHGLWLDATEIDRLERAHKPRAGFWELFFKGFAIDKNEH
jgi:Zn-finger nucleic acid-binding protein